MNETAKRYLHSSAVTFISAFLFVFLPYLMEVQAFEDFHALRAVLIASVLAGVRAVSKFLYELKFRKK